MSGPTTRTGRILADFVRDSGNADLVEDIEEEAALAERARLRDAWLDLVDRVEASGADGAAAAVGLLFGGNALFFDSPADPDEALS